MLLLFAILASTKLIAAFYGATKWGSSNNTLKVFIILLCTGSISEAFLFATAFNGVPNLNIGEVYVIAEIVLVTIFYWSLSKQNLLFITLILIPLVIIEPSSYNSISTASCYVSYIAMGLYGLYKLYKSKEVFLVYKPEFWISGILTMYFKSILRYCL